MKIFLVGGAVRDQLLNYPYSERDWVVVGATAEQLVQQGFTPVGKDFPVFLHPKTREEYALARTERKTGHGYVGFTVYAEPDVTLEDDLARRDLTINAIAQSEDGELIDPYGGAADIKARILRHVSPAFAEDPLRVLRVARFAARYHSLGFTIAPETLALMQQIVASGEIDHLVAERSWRETARALGEQHPHIYIQVLRQCGALARIMPELDVLFGVPQPPQHHPEIDTGIHSLMVLEQAAKLSDAKSVRFAALMHDLGKGTTPKQEWPRHIGHETRGLAPIKTLCQRLKVPGDYRDLALLASEFHTHVHRAFELTPKTMLKVFKQTDAFRRPERFGELLLCCKADARGRPGFEQEPYLQTEYMQRAFNHCRKVDVQALVNAGYQGAELGERIDRERTTLLARFKKTQDANNHE